MRKLNLLLIMILLLVVPNILFSVFPKEKEKQDLSFSPTESLTEHIPITDRVIRVKHENTILELDFDAYLLCVLLGEIPAEFETETLKAQAVATRTYTLRRLQGKAKHADADFCTSAQCCQAYKSIQDYVSTVGEMRFVEKMRDAISMTEYQVLVYDGVLIEATYFSCSGGKTEDAIAVWGTDVPYLQSVDSPGEENSRHYSHQIVFSKAEFLAKLGLDKNTKLTESDLTVTYTDGGGIETLWIGEKSFSGTELRSVLSLPSTFATISITGDSVEVVTRGYGHRVGMSQYGAEAMAVSGSTYTAILAHYYPGTKLLTFTSEEFDAVFDKAGNL